MLELVHEHLYAQQQESLIAQLPRLQEVFECAEWQISEDYKRFNLVDEATLLYVWRSNDSDIAQVPTIEVAYRYSLDDGQIYLLGVRIVPIEES